MAPRTSPGIIARAFAAVVLGSSFQAATSSALSSGLSNGISSVMNATLGAIREVYTTNAICGKKNCVNPVFPGMEDLHRLQQSKWVTSSLKKTAPSMSFCKNAITYDPALPVPNGAGASVKHLVQRQDNAASTMFYYHLNGLGLEAWDYQKPEFADDCVKSIWRMTCYTYFPRAEIGTQDGAWSNYVRPCKSSCQNYVRSCGVECCDESVQCVFSHTKAISATQRVTTEGYAPHDGPSSLCTGAAGRSAKAMGAVFWAVMLLVMAMAFQGVDGQAIHNVGNWRGQPDYLIKHAFVSPGGKTPALNTCSMTTLSSSLQCSGRGVCKAWDPSNIESTLAFCECDRDWADPECRTKRRSQVVAYILSLFFGFLGADQFYLGFAGAGLLKLFTFGGFGILWITDIVRIGSANVYANGYRTAADLPHYGFVLSATFFACLLGFVIAYIVTVNIRHSRRKQAFLLQLDEDKRQRQAMIDYPVDAKQGMYGSMMPTKMMP